MKRRLILGIAALVASGTASSENLNIISTDYQFIIERKSGRIESCGIHISAALQGPDSRVIGFQGSINSMYMAGRTPAIVAKAVLVAPEADGIVHVPLYGAAYQGEDVDTFNLKQMDGESQSRMIVAFMDENPDEFMLLPIGAGVGYRVFLTTDPEKRDLTFKLPPIFDVEGGKKVMSDYLACDTSASKGWISDMEEQIKAMGPE